MLNTWKGVVKFFVQDNEQKTQTIEISRNLGWCYQQPGERVTGGVGMNTDKLIRNGLFSLVAIYMLFLEINVTTLLAWAVLIMVWIWVSNVYEKAELDEKRAKRSAMTKRSVQEKDFDIFSK